MNILALDTSGEVLSVALAAESGVSCIEIDAGMRHSELLMDCVQRLCSIAGIKPADLALIACMKGPGSFTGLRIGFSAAKGIALALNIPLRAIPTLDCLAWPLSVWPGIALPAMDAKKGCFFTALYREGQRLTEYMDASPAAIADAIAAELDKNGLSTPGQILLTGCGAPLLYSHLAAHIPPENMKIDPKSKKGGAKELLEIIKGTIVNKDDSNTGPIYLRKSDAELKNG